MGEKRLAKTQDFLTTGDVAKRAGVTRTTVLHWIKAGELRAALTTVGGHYRITEADLERFFAVHRSRQSQVPAKRPILVVDDDASVRDMFVAALRPAFPGREIQSAADGVDAGMKLLRLAPALLILDLMLPGIDGFEVCRLVRSDPQLRDMSILCITGYNQPDIYEKAMRAGADDCIFKPIELETLRGRVRELLRTPRRKSSGTSEPAC